MIHLFERSRAPDSSMRCTHLFEGPIHGLKRLFHDPGLLTREPARQFRFAEAVRARPPESGQ